MAVIQANVGELINSRVFLEWRKRKKSHIICSLARNSPILMISASNKPDMSRNI